MTAAFTHTWMLIGDWSIARTVELQQLLKSQRCLPPMSLPDAIAAAELQAAVVDSVLVLQSVPDEFAPTEIDRIIGLLPLAHWTVCVGEWCDSIGRTEQHWPVGWCVPLRDAESRISLVLDRLQSDAAPLPPTASRDEAFAFTAQLARASQPHEKPQAFVDGDDRQVVETVRAMLSAEGCVISMTPCAGLNVLAATLPDSATEERVALFREQQPQSAIWVATDLITPEQCNALRRIGADRVVSALRFSEALAAAECRTHANFGA